MITLSIPGRHITLQLENLLLDLNGTIAVDGTIITGVRERLEVLKEKLNIYILTADTFGAAKVIGEELGIEVYKVSPEIGALDKRDILNTLQGDKTAAIGNGYNDRLMLEKAALSIVVMEAEGCSLDAMKAGDIAVRDINDALDLLIKPLRIIATLRS